LPREDRVLGEFSSILDHQIRLKSATSSMEKANEPHPSFHTGFRDADCILDRLRTGIGDAGIGLRAFSHRQWDFRHAHRQHFE
jgi:hypothetical protein